MRRKVPCLNDSPCLRKDKNKSQQRYDKYEQKYISGQVQVGSYSA